MYASAPGVGSHGAVGQRRLPWLVNVQVYMLLESSPPALFWLLWHHCCHASCPHDVHAQRTWLGNRFGIEAAEPMAPMLWATMVGGCTFKIGLAFWSFPSKITYHNRIDFIDTPPSASTHRTNQSPQWQVGKGFMSWSINPSFSICRLYSGCNDGSKTCGIQKPN
jgi:hypothetical protein